MSTNGSSLKLERELLRHVGVVIGFDEVGRGAIAGPVEVAALAVGPSTRSIPRGLGDSKLLSAKTRLAMVDEIKGWALWWGIGSATASEIDEIGIMRALRLAGERAMGSFDTSFAGLIVDGPYDWLSRPLVSERTTRSVGGSRTITMVKADAKCASVAAASILAKVHRDRLMDEYSKSYPMYQWEANKGYATRAHREALTEFGTSPLHRKSWNIRD